MSKITAYTALSAADSADVLPIVDVDDTTMAASGTTKKITVGALGLTAYPDQRPALDDGFTSLTLLMAALANRNNARCDIPVIGDSVTEGHGATAFTSRWIANANRAIRGRYPTTANSSSGGLGLIPIQSTGETSYTWPVTQASGTPGEIDVGPVRYAANIFAAGLFTWTAPAGTTSVKIMYYDAAVSGSFTYKVNSGSTTTVTNASGGDGSLTSSITMTSGDVLTIAWVSGSIFPEGIIHYAGDESSGVTFHGCGHFGWNAGTGSSGWQQTGSGFDWRPAIAALASGAVGIMLGINDASTSGANFTASQFQTQLANLITYLRGNSSLSSLPVLLIIPYQPNETFADSGGWAAYAAAIRAVQAANSNCQVIDLSYRLPAVASGFDGGALYSGTLHPSNLGHALIGEIAAAGVRIA